jgi:hypothetical protein
MKLGIWCNYNLDAPTSSVTVAVSPVSVCSRCRPEERFYLPQVEVVQGASVLPGRQRPEAMPPARLGYAEKTARKERTQDPVNHGLAQI